MSLYLGLQYLIDTKTIADETVLRYLIGHPVSKITVAMFLIGMSSLLVIGWNLVQQFSAEREITLGEIDSTESRITDIREAAVDHGQAMLDLPDRLHSHYLWERLVNAVHSIYRTGSTSNVEEELKYLSDIDLERQQQRYSLVRILIWATPMLGFLGTVLGISQALGGIAIGPDNDFQQMMDGLRGNLYIAFDTTALALTLSMTMMFGQFLIERFESQLLRLVDQRARSEVSRHYELTAAGGDGSPQVVEAIQNVVSGQTEIWRDSIRKAEQAWTASLTQTNDLVRSNLTESLDENVASLAHYLGEAIEKADDSISQRWSQWQVSLSENARLMEKHMLLLSKQTESVQQIVGSLEDSTAFDSALKHQQDAVMATTRTHRVLNELLRKVEEAGMVQAAESIVAAAADQDAAVSDEAPAVETSDVEAPVVEAPAVDAPAVDAPVVEAPAVVKIAPKTSAALVDADIPIEKVASATAGPVVSKSKKSKPSIRIYNEDANQEEKVDLVKFKLAKAKVAKIKLAKVEPEPAPQLKVNQSNSARIARALAGDNSTSSDAKSVPQIRVRKPTGSNESSNGNRRAA